MNEGAIIAIVGLGLTCLGLIITLGIAYLKEKSDTGKRENAEAKREGGLVEKVDNLVIEFRKLNGTTHDIAKQASDVEKRIQRIEDICPVAQKYLRQSCEVTEKSNRL